MDGMYKGRESCTEREDGIRESYLQGLDTGMVYRGMVSTGMVHAEMVYTRDGSHIQRVIYRERRLDGLQKNGTLTQSSNVAQSGFRLRGANRSKKKTHVYSLVEAYTGSVPYRGGSAPKKWHISFFFSVLECES